MSPTGAPLCCVRAVLVRDRRILLIQRKNPPAKNLWSVPGGHVELGESWHAAVEREVREETSLEARCGKFLGWVEREASGSRYLIADFEIDADNIDEASPRDDASDLIFASHAELDQLELTPGLLDFLTRHNVLGS